MDLCLIDIKKKEKFNFYRRINSCYKLIDIVVFKTIIFPRKYEFFFNIQKEKKRQELRNIIFTWLQLFAYIFIKMNEHLKARMPRQVNFK